MKEERNKIVKLLFDEIKLIEFFANWLDSEYLQMFISNLRSDFLSLLIVIAEELENEENKVKNDMKLEHGKKNEWECL